MKTVFKYYKTVFKYCYASVVLNNVVVLYFEDGFVYNTPVLKDKTATVFFSPNFFFFMQVSDHLAPLHNNVRCVLFSSSFAFGKTRFTYGTK